jgi:hypothetical protein
LHFFIGFPWPSRSGVVAKRKDLLFVTMVPPPGQVWSIESKAYNCLAYLFTSGKIPVSLTASPVRNAHPTFAPWKHSSHTTNWRTNFTAMRKLSQDGKLKWDKEMISEADKAEMDGNIATIVRRYEPLFGADAGDDPPARDSAEDDKYTDEDVEDVRKSFGGKCSTVVSILFAFSINYFYFL